MAFPHIHEIGHIPVYHGHISRFLFVVGTLLSDCMPSCLVQEEPVQQIIGRHVAASLHRREVQAGRQRTWVWQLAAPVIDMAAHCSLSISPDGGAGRETMHSC